MPQEFPVAGKTYIGTFPTPLTQDKYLYLRIDSRQPGRQAMLPDYGDPHEDQVNYTDYRVAWIGPDKEAGAGWWLIIYTKDREDQEEHNASRITFPYGSNSYPRIEREYIFSKQQYSETAPLALGTADPEVDGSGTAVWPSCTLIEPDIILSSTGDPVLDNLYVKVIRVFEILPGAAITTTRLAEDGSAITVTKQRMLVGSIVTSETLTGGTTPWVRKYKGQGNAYYAEQITESRPIPGNGIVNTRIDEDGIPVTITRTLKAVGSITTGETLSASPTGTWTKVTRADADSTLVAFEVSEARAIPGNSLPYRVYDPLTETTVEETRQLISAAVDDYDYSLLTNLQDYKDVPYEGTLVKMRTIRTYPSGITSKSIVEYRRERTSFPALLSDYATSSGALQSGRYSDGTTFFLVNDVIEAERPRTFAAKVTTTFQTNLTSPPLPTVLDIKPQRLSYNGALRGVAFNTGPVLCNVQSITATIGTGDPNWTAGTSETVSIPASSPTKDQWITRRTANNWFIADFQVKKIANSLYMVSKVEFPYL